MEMETLFGGRGITRFTQRTEETVIRVCTLGQKVGCVVWWLCSLSLVLMQAKKKTQPEIPGEVGRGLPDKLGRLWTEVMQ